MICLLSERKAQPPCQRSSPFHVTELPTKNALKNGAYNTGRKPACPGKVKLHISEEGDVKGRCEQPFILLCRFLLFLIMRLLFFFKKNEKNSF